MEEGRWQLIPVGFWLPYAHPLLPSVQENQEWAFRNQGVLPMIQTGTGSIAVPLLSPTPSHCGHQAWDGAWVHNSPWHTPWSLG